MAQLATWRFFSWIFSPPNKTGQMIYCRAMKVLVIGGGGREHAIVWKLAQSHRINKLFCAPGNAGTGQMAENVPIEADDLGALLQFAKKEKIDFTVVGPEGPLVKGIVDLFAENGLSIFGPSKAAAQLEGSKIFMKRMLVQSGVPTAPYKTYTSSKSSIAASAMYYARFPDKPQVIKVDGLAGGKGVLVSKDLAEITTFVTESMDLAVFGDSGKKIIIEEFLDGEEASYIVAADGTNYVPLASAQDHKRVFDGDSGPNTGGMGAYSPAPVVTPELDAKIRKRVIEPILKTMRAEGAPFKGFLYAGVMVVKGEPYVLEFNVRLGDPEAQPILFRYQGDLLELMEACAKGDVSGVKPEWKKDSAVCIVMASGGYPGAFEKGFPIEGLNNALPNTYVFHAGTKVADGKVVTSGGRVLGVTAGAPTIKEAVRLAYECAGKISFKGAHYRKDIARRAIR